MPSDILSYHSKFFQKLLLDEEVRGLNFPKKMSLCRLRDERVCVKSLKWGLASSLLVLSYIAL